MNSISFENFRKFAKFPTIDLGDVTVLVGGNNSGKSTVVKALLLCADNLLLMRMNDRRRDESKSVLSFSKPLFRFDANEFHDVKVKTFARAIHNKPVEEKVDISQMKVLQHLAKENGEEVSTTYTEEGTPVVVNEDFLSHDIMKDGKYKTVKVLPSTMTFHFTIGHFEFFFVVSGDRDNKNNIATGDVESITIVDHQANVRYNNNYANGTMSFVIHGENNNLISQMENEEDDDELIEKLDINLYKTLKNAHTPRALYQMPLGIFQHEVQEPVLLNVISNILFFVKYRDVLPEKKEGESPEEYSDRVKKCILTDGYRASNKHEEDLINRSYRELERLLDTFSVEYISAHAANQNTLYNTADRNDYIAQTVHDFYREKIVPGEKEFQIILDWMKTFEIGSSFDIMSIGGEAYQVSITDSDGSSAPLADKGMGSIQMMILLLRLATIMRRNKKANEEVGVVNLFDVQTPSLPTTVIIEEPEQNLHPRLQSWLADLFLYLKKEANMRFIIETHSEYLIRKTQVLVAQENYEDEDALKENNPFMVYYFDGDNEKKPYYQMEYELSGAFKDKFGEGFFDEASKLDMTIIRKEFELKKKNRK